MKKLFCTIALFSTSAYSLDMPSSLTPVIMKDKEIRAVQNVFINSRKLKCKPMTATFSGVGDGLTEWTFSALRECDSKNKVVGENYNILTTGRVYSMMGNARLRVELEAVTINVRRRE